MVQRVCYYSSGGGALCPLLRGGLLLDAAPRSRSVIRSLTCALTMVRPLGRLHQRPRLQDLGLHDPPGGRCCLPALLALRPALARGSRGFSEGRRQLIQKHKPPWDGLGAGSESGASLRNQISSELLTAYSPPQSFRRCVHSCGKRISGHVRYSIRSYSRPTQRPLNYNEWSF